MIGDTSRSATFVKPPPTPLLCVLSVVRLSPVSAMNIVILLWTLGARSVSFIRTMPLPPRVLAASKIGR